MKSNELHETEDVDYGVCNELQVNDLGKLKETRIDFNPISFDDAVTIGELLKSGETARANFESPVLDKGKRLAQLGKAIFGIV